MNVSSFFFAPPADVRERKLTFAEAGRVNIAEAAFARSGPKHGAQLKECGKASGLGHDGREPCEGPGQTLHHQPCRRYGQLW